MKTTEPLPLMLDLTTPAVVKFNGTILVVFRLRRGYW